MKEVERLPLKDFTRYCMSIAQVPSSYIAGLTIEEQLLWLCSFLTNEVIPTVNNNGEAVEELQQLYVQLHDYVENYFDNLDIQAEVNSKLEDMAQSGELAELISQYLESQAIIGFNTCSALAAAENLANGSFAKTYGQNAYNDTKGAFYRVRQRLNSDDPDGYNIIVLTNTDNLVAVKVSYSDYELNSQISDNTSRIAGVERNAIYLGNSYTNGTGSTSGHDGLFALTKDMFNNAYKFCGSGTGFLGYTNHTNDTFDSHLDDAIASTTIDKDSITDFIIVGAWGESNEFNEYGSNSFASQIETAANSLVSKIKTNYPNVKNISYIYAESRNTKNPTTSIGTTNLYSTMWYVNNYLNVLLPRCGIQYKGWIGFNILMNSSAFSSDNKHPNDTGYKELASLFKSAYNGGFEYKLYFEGFTNYTCGLTEGSKISGNIQLTPDNCIVTITSMEIHTGTVTFNNNYDLVDFASMSRMPAIPISNKDLGVITIPSTTTNSSSFNPGTDIYGTISFRANDDTTGMKIRLKAFGTRTIGTQINTSMHTPCQFIVPYKQVTGWSHPA